MSQTQVSGKRMLEKYEIEYNGQVFNCLQCSKENCCGTTDQNNANKVACQKCRCQQIYSVSDGTRSGNQPIGDMGCTNCSGDMTQTECNSYEFLNNKIIQNMNIVDCSNKVITAGANNSISDVSLKSTCNTGGPTMVNNIGTEKPDGPNWTLFGGIGGAIIVIIILIMLFK